MIVSAPTPATAPLIARHVPSNVNVVVVATTARRWINPPL
jgi:hypothetical protein